MKNAAFFIFLKSICNKLDRPVVQQHCSDQSSLIHNLHSDEIGNKFSNYTNNEKAGSFLIKKCCRNVIWIKYLWLQFISVTEVPISRWAGQTCRSKYSGEIFGENMQERGHSLQRKILSKICGRFLGWNSASGDITTYLSCFCPLYIQYKLSTLLLKRQPWDNPGLN